MGLMDLKNELEETREQLEEERQIWKRKRNEKNKQISKMQNQINEMEEEIDDQKLRISSLEKQKANMEKCVKKKTDYYDIHSLVNERRKKHTTEYEVQWNNSWMSEDKIPADIVNKWKRKKVKREKSTGYRNQNNGDDDGHSTEE